MMKRIVTAAAVALTMLVAGCTSSGGDVTTSATTSQAILTTVEAPDPSTDTATTTKTDPQTGTSDLSSAGQATSAGETTSPGEATSAGESTRAGETTSPGEATSPGEQTSPGEITSAPGPATYTPPADAEAAPGDCPYLSLDQVAGDTGQRTGPAAIRAAAPFPVCEFIKSGGAYLATVRVLQFGTDAEAVAAVDYYLPRETSEPATKPDGWVGGLMDTPDGNGVSPGNPEALSVYGVSKGTTAVIATTNQEQTVYARELVKHAISNLGL